MNSFNPKDIIDLSVSNAMLLRKVHMDDEILPLAGHRYRPK